jgi:hypothetical protein
MGEYGLFFVIKFDNLMHYGCFAEPFSQIWKILSEHGLQFGIFKNF